MKTPRYPNRRGLAILGAVLLLVSAFPRQSYAVFGFGDIVFDPTSYATLGHIWSEDISNGAKILQEYNQLVQLYSNAVAQYQLAKQMAQRLSQKSTWITVGTRATNEVTESRYGEAINWSAAMNGDFAHAAAAYRNATTQIRPDLDLSHESPGSSYQLANLATVETMDGANVACLQSVAQYRADQQANQAASDALTASVIDDSDRTNATVAQLNQLNAASAQERAEAQSRGTLEACLVEQQVLANKMQRDTQVEAMNTYAVVQKAYATNPMQLSSASTALKADLQ